MFHGYKGQGDMLFICRASSDHLLPLNLKPLIYITGSCILGASLHPEKGLKREWSKGCPRMTNQVFEGNLLLTVGWKPLLGHCTTLAPCSRRNLSRDAFSANQRQCENHYAVCTRVFPRLVSAAFISFTIWLASLLRLHTLIYFPTMLLTSGSWSIWRRSVEPSRQRAYTELYRSDLTTNNERRFFSCM